MPFTHDLNLNNRAANLGSNLKITPSGSLRAKYKYLCYEVMKFLMKFDRRNALLGKIMYTWLKP